MYSKLPETHVAWLSDSVMIYHLHNTYINIQGDLKVAPFCFFCIPFARMIQLQLLLVDMQLKKSGKNQLIHPPHLRCAPQKSVSIWLQQYSCGCSLAESNKCRNRTQLANTAVKP